MKKKANSVLQNVGQQGIYMFPKTVELECEKFCSSLVLRKENERKIAYRKRLEVLTEDHGRLFRFLIDCCDTISALKLSLSAEYGRVEVITNAFTSSKAT